MTPENWMPIAEKVVLISACISMSLQGLKQFIPALQGKWAKIFAIVSSLAATFAFTSPEYLLTSWFLAQAVLTALSTIGVYHLVHAKAT